MRLHLWALFALVCGLSQANLFYSADSVPAEIEYQTTFKIALSEFNDPIQTTKGSLQLSVEDEAHLQEGIQLHYRHLYGVFTYHTKPMDYASYNGSIQESPKIKIVSLQKNDKFLEVEYIYQDRAVFYTELLRGKKQTEIEFYLPQEPFGIYNASLPKGAKIDPKTKEPIHPCTSTYDNSEFAFWYYWNPFQKGCPKAILGMLEMVTAKIRVLAMTTTSYPEYDRLYSQGDTLRIEALVGKDHSLKKDDLGRIFFEQNANLFRDLIDNDGSALFNVKRKSSSHLQFNLDTDQVPVELNLRFVDSDKDDWFEKAGEWLANSDVMVFSGHSAEGYYFEPAELFGDHSGFELPKDRYQIFFFDMCTSYSYYHSNYFKLKKDPRRDPMGTASLDVLTNAIGAPFTFSKLQKGEPTSLSLLIMGLLGRHPDGKTLEKLPSWQQILQSITDTAGFDFTALTNVLGDEDNPKRRKRGWQIPQKR